MGYFPFLVDISEKTVWVIGSGEKAREKITRLEPFHPNLILIPEFWEDRERIPPAFVVAASEDKEENRSVREYCVSRGIPVNVVDDKQDSDFLFPAMLTGDRLTVAVSTAGASPAAAAVLKEKIEELLPSRIEEILDWLESIRPEVKSAVPPAERSRVFRAIFRRCMELDRPLLHQELKMIYEKNG